MKATRTLFEAALRPVLDDLEREHPGLLRVEREPQESDLQAMLWEADGSGTGIYLGDGWASEAEAVAELADQVQEAAIEALWSATGKGAWPACAEHPNGPPLFPGLHDGRASWFLPDRRSSRVRDQHPWGSLTSRPSPPGEIRH